MSHPISSSEADNHTTLLSDLSSSLQDSSLSSSSSSSNLTNTNPSKNNKRQLIQIRKLVLVRRLGEVADLGNIHNRVAEVVLCGETSKISQ
jgi:hypothetical protein